MILLFLLLDQEKNLQSAIHHNHPEKTQQFLLSNQETTQQPEQSNQGMILQTEFYHKVECC